MGGFDKNKNRQNRETLTRLNRKTVKTVNNKQNKEKTKLSKIPNNGLVSGFSENARYIRHFNSHWNHAVSWPGATRNWRQATIVSKNDMFGGPIGQPDFCWVHWKNEENRSSNIDSENIATHQPRNAASSKPLSLFPIKT